MNKAEVLHRLEIAMTNLSVKAKITELVYTEDGKATVSYQDGWVEGHLTINLDDMDIVQWLEKPVKSPPPATGVSPKNSPPRTNRRCY